LVFREDMPPISERFDFVYAWSAIHYVAHSLELLARFVEYRPRGALKPFLRMMRTASWRRQSVVSLVLPK
jgi:hypothetical protein